MLITKCTLACFIRRKFALDVCLLNDLRLTTQGLQFLFEQTCSVPEELVNGNAQNCQMLRAVAFIAGLALLGRLQSSSPRNPPLPRGLQDIPAWELGLQTTQFMRD